MGLLNGVISFLHKNSSAIDDAELIKVYAPISGKIINLAKVPDPIFAEKIVGEGVAIDPIDNKLVAPISGTVSKIFATNHAFSILGRQGLELFVHFGIDAVELRGKGFTRIVKEGQTVVRGATVIALDYELISSQLQSKITPVIVVNTDMLSHFIPCKGSVVAGQDLIFSLHMREIWQRNGDHL